MFKKCITSKRHPAVSAEDVKMLDLRGQEVGSKRESGKENDKAKGKADGVSKSAGQIQLCDLVHQDFQNTYTFIIL